MPFFVCCALGALIQLIRLRSFGEPTGADGYFYLQQIQSLSTFQGFYYKDYSLAFAPPALLNLILRDPLLSYQITTSFLFGAIAWASVRLGVLLAPGWTRYRLVALYAVALAFVVFSQGLIELSYVFMKTGFAVLFFLLAMIAFKSGRRLPVIAFALAAVLSHKIMIVFVAAAALILLSQKFRSRRAWAAGGAGMVACAIALLILYPRALHQLRAVIDISAFAEKFSWATFLASPLEAMTLLGFAIAAAAMLALRRRWLALVALALLLPVFAPGADLTFRLMIVAAPFLLVAAVVLFRHRALVGTAVFASMIVLGVHYNRPLSTWVNPWGRAVTNVEALARELPPNALLYAPHGIEFYLAYKTPFRPRSLRIPADGRPVYRVAFVKPYMRAGSMLSEDMRQMAVAELGSDFFVFHEEDWLVMNQLHRFRPHAMNMLPEKPDFVATYD